MTKFDAALARERRCTLVRALWPLSIAIIVGLFIFGMTVPVTTKPCRETGRIVDFQERGRVEGGTVYYAYVLLADGRRIVVSIPSRQLCLIGQRVAVYRYRVWFGTQMTLGPEGCAAPR